MNTIFIATLGGMIALVLFGLSDWLASRSSKKFEELETNLAIQIPSFAILLPVFVMSGQSLPGKGVLLSLFLMALFYVAGWVCFIKALSTGKVGIVVPLANIYPLIVILMSAIFLTIKFSGLELGFMVMIVAGAVLLAYEKNNEKLSFKELHMESAFALLATLFWGLGIFFLNTIADKTTWQVIAGIEGTLTALVALILLIIVQKRKAIKSLKRIQKNRLALYSGVALAIGAVGLYYGTEKNGSALIPAVIASAAPLVTSLLGAVFDGERVGLIKRLGAVSVVAGIILLNIY